jgi:hypothetical protein
MHTALDDGVFDAKHFGYLGFHGGALWFALGLQRGDGAAL